MFTARRVSLVIGMVALATGASVLGTVEPASAATLTVCPTGCQYTSIQSALSAATAGDTIMIGPGSYAGGITVDKNVTLMGSRSAQTTISGGSPVITVSNGVRSTIRRLTITGGVTNPFGGGVNNAGTLTLADSAVSDNNTVTFPAFGSGIYNSGSLTLNNTTVAGNGGGGTGLIDNDGGGIYNTGSLTLNASTVAHNGALGSGGGIFNEGGTVTLNGSVVSNNFAGFGSGGGIYTTGTMTLNQSTVSDNGNGGGIFNSGSLMLNATTVARNAGDGSGGIANLGTVALNHSTVTGNNSGMAPGGGIYNYQEGRARLIDTTVSGNVGNDVGGGIYNLGALKLDHSTISANTPDDCFGC